jgi:hypothetical protein
MTPEQLFGTPWLLVLLVGFLFLLSLIVPVQASQRGYNFFVWLVAGMLGNPIFLLVLLAIMPDFARKARRRKELAALEKKLTDQVVLLDPADVLPVEDESLGDQPTILPPLRSIGDDETRA